MVSIFVEVVLPVFLIFLTGFVLQKWQQVNIKAVSTVAIYVLTPALVFPTLYEADLNQDYVIMIVFSLLLLAAIIIITRLYSWMRGYPQPVESGLILSTAFMNSGNYGAPLILFAFGQQGFDYAITLMVLQSVIMNFFGIYYAARSSAGVRLAIRTVLAMPPIYAAMIALALNVFDVTIPANLMSAIDLVSPAAIPVVMLVLGMQLAQIPLNGMQWSKISYGVVVRLMLSPLIAFVIVQFFSMNSLLEKVLIVSAAMPSAATTTMYAVQYDAEPDLVSSVTLITTLISIVTVTLLLAFLS